MKGKVFESSRDVYQDQARVLFDFYLNAAQKIVDQEDDFDNKYKELDGEIDSINESANHVKRDYIIGGALVILGIILVFVNPIIAAIVAIAGIAFLLKTYNFNKNIQSSINELEEKKQEILNAKANIYRDYKINKIGAVYIPVAKKVAFGDKSVVVDLTDGVPSTTISLQVANNPSALVNTLKDLKNSLPKLLLLKNQSRWKRLKRQIIQVQFRTSSSMITLVRWTVHYEQAHIIYLMFLQKTSRFHSFCLIASRWIILTGLRQQRLMMK